MSELSLLTPQVANKGLYDQDFFLWTQAIAQSLRSGDFAQLDIENLVEEVESLGRRDRRELESRLTVLLMHLLKWQFQAEMRSGSSRGTLVEQRLRIGKLLKESPSLRSVFEAMVEDCYGDARLLAAAETGMAIEGFPVGCLYGVEEILDMEFLPD